MAESKESYSSHRRIFVCRSKIDQSPGLRTTLEILLGSVAFAHLLISLVLLFVDLRARKIQDYTRDKASAVIPLIALCAEVTGLSFCIAASVVKDMCCIPRESLSVWQREALGRLLRNVVIGTLVGLSCVLWYLDSQPGSISSVTEVVLPALVAAAIGSTKVVLIRTDRTLFWLGLTVMCTVQLILLVLNYDFDLKLPWVWTVAPIYAISLDAMLLSLTVAAEAFSTGVTSRAFAILMCTIRLLAGAMLITTAYVSANYADASSNANYTDDPNAASLQSLVLLSIITFILCLFSLCRQCGNYILDIIWGHVETDVLHMKYPALLARQQSP